MSPPEVDLATPPLAQVFVYPARVKFLAVLADNPDESFSATELAEHAGTAASTWTSHRDDLLELELVDEIDTDGAYPEYSLAPTAHAQLLRQLSEDIDAVLYELNDPLSDAIGGFAQ
ncbi:helix-turn-helix domain-containing protein [Haladaptatus cibarius]|uniref:histidine kinase n=1 Tax=Haladaptatus cibarius TaxID=453847 RepID=UPI0006784ADD|nr:histidine kinase [Haladaptatus cibarius]